MACLGALSSIRQNYRPEPELRLELGTRHHLYYTPGVQCPLRGIVEAVGLQLFKLLAVRGAFDCNGETHQSYTGDKSEEIPDKTCTSPFLIGACNGRANLIGSNVCGTGRMKNDHRRPFFIFKTIHISDSLQIRG